MSNVNLATSPAKREI